MLLLMFAKPFWGASNWQVHSFAYRKQCLEVNLSIENCFFESVCFQALATGLEIVHEVCNVDVLLISFAHVVSMSNWSRLLVNKWRTELHKTWRWDILLLPTGVQKCVLNRIRTSKCWNNELSQNVSSSRKPRFLWFISNHSIAFLNFLALPN